MAGDRRPMLTGILLGAAAATFSLAVTFNAATAMPAVTTVHAAQAGLVQVEKIQYGPRFRGPRRGFRGGRRVCFWRFGRRVCVWR